MCVYSSVAPCDYTERRIRIMYTKLCSHRRHASRCAPAILKSCLSSPKNTHTHDELRRRCVQRCDEPAPPHMHETRIMVEWVMLNDLLYGWRLMTTMMRCYPSTEQRHYVLRGPHFRKRGTHTHWHTAGSTDVYSSDCVR